VHDTAAIRAQYLALTKAWWPCFIWCRRGWCVHTSYSAVHQDWEAWINISVSTALKHFKHVAILTKITDQFAGKRISEFGRCLVKLWNCDRDL